MTRLIGLVLGLVLGLTAVLAALPAAMAQDGPPNALQGFSQNRNKPVNIESTSLEVRDKSKEATFLGNVRMVQGDTTLRSKSLVVFYDQDAGPGAAMKAPQPTPNGGQQQMQQIKRLEARGGIVVSQLDQTVTGESGVFDMKANTVTVLGNVVLTRGESVIEGDRLVVDLTTGMSKLDKKNGKVKALFVPGEVKTDSKSDSKSANKSDGKSDVGKESSPKSLRPAGLY